MLSIIVAMDKNNLIGNNNKLPWHLPADLTYFKKITLGKTIIMGRNTFESIGRPLPNRNNIIITRDKKFSAKNCKIVFSLKEAINNHSKQELIIIGGSNIYKQTINLVDKLYITMVSGNFNGDAYFPKFNLNQYRETQNIACAADANNQFDYNFITLNKIQ